MIQTEEESSFSCQDYNRPHRRRGIKGKTVVHTYLSHSLHTNSDCCCQLFAWEENTSSVYLSWGA